MSGMTIDQAPRVKSEEAEVVAARGRNFQHTGEAYSGHCYK